MSATSSDPPSHSELVRLPPSLENIDAKMNHIIARLEVGIAISERAERTAEKARDLAEKARDAARNSGSIAVRAVQGVDSLPKRERLMAVAAGSVVGGAAVSFFVWVAVFAIGTAGLSACIK